ncbi:acyltransferase family protein [Roseateles aquatilis]|nr:acyltransferase family protein [Roseateles aquatilis]
MTASPTRQPGYRHDIDGLRSIAVLSVVAYHFGLPLPGGFTGVDIFFVISGYLIGSHIYGEAREGRFSYARFYYRRARRIVPALIAVLLFTGVAMALLASPQEFHDFGRDAVAAVFSVSNITLYRSIDYFRPAAEMNPLLMTWSLGVEEQFYLLAPVVLTLVARLRASWRFAAVAAIAALSLLLAVWQMRHDTQAAFYLLPPRAWELGAGVMLALWRAHHAAPIERRHRLSTEIAAWLGLALLIVPIVAYDHATRFPGLTALPPVLGAVLLLHTDGAFVNRRLLSNPVATFFGLISYSLYLWHWPLISMAHLVLETEPPLAWRVLLAALSVALAYGSYRWIETPFRQSPTPVRRSLSRYALVMSAAAAVTGSAYLAGGYPQRWPDGFVAQAAGATATPSPCLANYGVTAPRLSGDCVATGGQPSLALVGDSHASAMSPAMRALAGSASLGYEELTKSSCPFLQAVSRAMTRFPQHADECAAFNRQVMDRLLARPEIRVVVIGGFWRVGLTDDGPYASMTGAAGTPPEHLRQGLAASVEPLVRAGKRVVVLGDVPYFAFMPIKRVAACGNPLRAALNGLPDHDRACEYGTAASMIEDPIGEVIVRDVARRGGATYLDPRQGLCDGEGCRFAARARMLYVDQQHLSAAGAAMAAAPMAPWLTGRIDRPMAMLAPDG